MPCSHEESWSSWDKSWRISRDSLGRLRAPRQKLESNKASVNRGKRVWCWLLTSLIPDEISQEPRVVQIRGRLPPSGTKLAQTYCKLGVRATEPGWVSHREGLVLFLENKIFVKTFMETGQWTQNNRRVPRLSLCVASGRLVVLERDPTGNVIRFQGLRRVPGLLF